MPRLVREAIGLAWATNRRDAVASIGLNIAAGVMTTLGLLATTSVLRELFAAGPTPDRVRSALPALVVAAVAMSTRGGLAIAAGWAQARLTPQINYQVELRLFEATTAVELAAFDDAGFAEEMDRARDRGMAEAAYIVDRDAALLICDEPSAALDARAEHALFQHLRRRPDRAVVLITHRLANVRHADRIFVLDRGRLVQQGTHDELMAADGLYRELFDLQASGYLAGTDEALPR